MEHDNHALRPIRYVEDAQAVADALESVESDPLLATVSAEIAGLARDAASNPEHHNLTSRQ